MFGFTNLSENRKGILALVFLAFVFATMGMYARYLQTDFALFQQIYLRVLGAAFLGTVIFWKYIDFHKLPGISKKDWSLIVFRGLTFGFGVVFFTLAFLTTKYSNATFVAAIPLLPLLGYFLLGEKIGAKKIFYITLGFLGLAVIAIHDFTNVFLWGRGELFAVLSAIAFDISYIARKWQSEYLNDKESVILIFLIEAVFVFMASFVSAEGLPGISSFNVSTIGVFILASLANIANLYFVNYAFARVEAHVAGNMLTLETAFALVFGVLIYHEIPAIRELIGGVLIVFSVYQMNKITH